MHQSRPAPQLESVDIPALAAVSSAHFQGRNGVVLASDPAAEQVDVPEEITA